MNDILHKPFSEACEINKTPILAVLSRLFAEPGRVLEIGAGTGQHAVHFAQHLKHLQWMPTDTRENLSGIDLWVKEAGLDNLDVSKELDIAESHWQQEPVEYVYSANTVHIMSWPLVEQLFAGLDRVMSANALFVLYGPFNYNGTFTSESNARFDQWLKQRDSRSGVRDFEQLDALAATAGLTLLEDVEMPINNRCLVWVKKYPTN